jgi:hypothetical protein
MKRSVLPSPASFLSRLAKEPNELRKKMLLLGYISERMSKRNASVFLVGGQAVETYTGGVFTTGDIDITTTDTKGTEALLEKLGFAKEGMIWVSVRLGLAVHLVASYPRRSIRHRTFEVGGYLVKVVGVEDLVVDRLSAAKFWKSERDAEQANALLNVFRDSIDERYLEELARAENVYDFLLQAKGRSEKGRHEVK